MGLENCSDRLVRDLSGGEKKRLSIALEIIDDPAILFLDEPTTGLDSLTAIQCLQMLKKLSSHGRIVVCSIHVPSNTMLELFDFLYIISSGECIYQGSLANILPFLESSNSPCPEATNPIEHILESSVEAEYQCNYVNSIANGENNDFRHVQPESNLLDANDKSAEMRMSNSMLLDCNYTTQNGSSIVTQIAQLLRRMTLTYARNPCLIFLRFIIHFAIAVFIGMMYSNTGNEASKMFNIFRFLFFNIFILAFTAFSSIQTTCE